jgi:hypothetical protein
MDCLNDVVPEVFAGIPRGLSHVGVTCKQDSALWPVFFYKVGYQRSITDRALVKGAVAQCKPVPRASVVKDHRSESVLVEILGGMTANVSGASSNQDGRAVVRIHPSIVVRGSVLARRTHGLLILLLSICAGH